LNKATFLFKIYSRLHLSDFISQFSTITLFVNDDLHRVQVQYILHYSTGTVSYNPGM